MSGAMYTFIQCIAGHSTAWGGDLMSLGRSCSQQLASARLLLNEPSLSGQPDQLLCCIQWCCAADGKQACNIGEVQQFDVSSIGAACLHILSGHPPLSRHWDADVLHAYLFHQACCCLGVAGKAIHSVLLLCSYLVCSVHASCSPWFVVQVPAVAQQIL